MVCADRDALRLVRSLRRSLLRIVLLVTAAITYSSGDTTVVEHGQNSLGYECSMDEFEHRLPDGWNECTHHPIILLLPPISGGEYVANALGLETDHAPAADRKSDMSQQNWDCAFKIATTRNPWSRWVAWYQYCSTGYGDPPLIPSPKWACEYARSVDVSEFVKYMITTMKGLHRVEPDIVQGLTKRGETYEKIHFFESLASYVAGKEDKEDLMPHMLLKYEFLGNDFSCLASLLGVRARFANKFPTPEQIRMGEVDLCRKLDTEARDLIREFNSYEIEKFGYDFPVKES